MNEPSPSAWGDDDVVAEYGTDGVTDTGERAALAEVERWARGRVLDLGVGGGRTTGLLAPSARSYLGLDVSGEMLDLARSRFPAAFLLRGNARDLAGLDDDAFDLVVFSFNGLDALDRADRADALAEMVRVVRPDGRVVFSSLNRDGASFDETPWRVTGGPRSPRGRVVLRHALRHPRSAVRGMVNFRRTRTEAEDGERWARRPMRAHEFRFVVHFATLEEIVAGAGAAGLEVLSVHADDGRRLDVAADRTDADYVHLVCRPRRS